MEIGPVKVSLQPPRGTVAIGTPELGTFRPLTGALRPGTGIVSTGQVIGFLKDPGILIPICSPFSGRFMGWLGCRESGSGKDSRSHSCEA
jgi:hypothetical protein